MLPRILETELMDTADDAHEYDAMDHVAVNAQFVTDLLELLDATKPLQILDLGAGTAQIPIELARRSPHIHITAIDAAESMILLAYKNTVRADMKHRIGLVLADAKDLRNSSIGRNLFDLRVFYAQRNELRFVDGAFNVVISNSILHHIPDPRDVVAEAIRVTAPGGLLFHRDLARPTDETLLDGLVNAYAGDATLYQRKLFSDSLHAALTIEEMRELVVEFGFAPETVQMTSDRHWTWIVGKLRSE